MQRIVIIGTSCSGKSTMAQRLSFLLGHPHIELDSLYWLPQWMPRSKEEFRENVLHATAIPQWIIDGNYSVVRNETWALADTIIWLNYPFRVVMYRALKRSFHRLITRKKICNGNTESFRQTFFSRESILWWVITTYHRRKKDYSQLLQQPQYSHHHIVELRTPQQTEDFLCSLSLTEEQLQKKTAPSE